MLHILARTDEDVLTDLEIEGDQENLEQFVTHLLAAIERGETHTVVGDTALIIRRIG